MHPSAAGTISTKVLFGALLLVVFLCAAWFALQSSFIRQIGQPNPVAYSVLQSGDITQAGLQARTILNGNSGSVSDSDLSWLHFISADAYAASATSSTSSVSEAMSGILTEYHDVSDPFTRAWILNRLILLIPNSDPNTVRSGLSEIQSSV